MERSDETKAVAYVSEDKTFGTKYWVWGSYSGDVLQPEANRFAMEKCQAALANVRSQQAGGQPVYDFGAKKCELYEFTNNKVSAIALAKAAQPNAPIVASVQQVSVVGEWCMFDRNQEPTSCGYPSWEACNAKKPDINYLCTEKEPQSPIASPTQQPAGQGTSGTVTTRLRELEQLRKEGLITQQEYEEKRKAVLSTL